MPVAQAEQIFDAFLASKPSIADFIDWSHNFVLKHGYVETMQGFRRNLMGAFSKDRKTRNEALRQSVNTIVQGTGAYLTNLSVVYLVEWLETRNLRSKVVLTVHDSIVLDCPPEEIEEVARTAQFIMENLPVDFLTVDWIDGTPQRYPIASDVEIGETYNDVVKYYPEEFKTFQSVRGYVKYHQDLKTFEHYENIKAISKEDKERGQAVIKASKATYQALLAEG